MNAGQIFGAVAARMSASLQILLQDLRFSARILRKSPGFAITTILTLSLGIAAAVAIFGFVDSALIRPLPYANPARLMGVFETYPAGGMSGYSYPNYLDLERSNRVFDSIGAYDVRGGFVLSEAGAVHDVNGTGVTNDFFRILGVSPMLGRDFSVNPADEDLQSVPPTVILSYAAWQNWFGGGPDVVGKTVTLNGGLYAVIGVLPRSFQFDPAGAADFWTTLHPFAGDRCYLSRGCAPMGVVARLKDGVTLQQALADVLVIAAREARDHPDPDRYRSATILPLGRVILGNIQPILRTLMGGAELLLLIAYFNVAGLLLVRSEYRRREFAVRCVLGAARGRLIQQFITEGFVIVALSSVLGLFSAAFAQLLLLKLIPANTLDSMPYLRGSWNWHTTVFATALAIIAGVLFAVVPAIQLPFTNLRAGLTRGDRGRAGTAWRHLGAKLVVLELATTMVVLGSAALLGKSLYELLHVGLGFDSSHLATLSVGAPTLALQREIVSRLQSLPGVTAVGMTSGLPVTGVGSTQVGYVGRPNLGMNNEVGHRVVSAGYLPVLEAQLLQGRHFSENDNANAPLVAIINQALAREYFTGENPIGKQFFYWKQGTIDGPQHPTQIVGLIADVKEYALDETAKPVIYTPLEQSPSRGFCIVARTSQKAGSVLPSLIATIHEIDPGILTSDGNTMSEIIQGSPPAYWHRASAWLTGSFAAIALLLSSVGIFGLIAYSVSQRTREIGIRMALGASRNSVYQMILKEAGWLTLIGLVIGLPGVIAAGLLLRSLLFGVRSWDVSILCTVATVLLSSALLASYIPARRAASVNPIEALRAE
jgi:macrolide transport system ATP-binding/permease protein